jgi:hypothetical protein
MSDTSTASESITDGVNNMTVRNNSIQQSDWVTTVDTDFSGDTLTVIKPDPLPQRGRKPQKQVPPTLATFVSATQYS